MGVLPQASHVLISALVHEGSKCSLAVSPSLNVASCWGTAVKAHLGVPCLCWGAGGCTNQALIQKQFGTYFTEGKLSYEKASEVTSK